MSKKLQAFKREFKLLVIKHSAGVIADVLKEQLELSASPKQVLESIAVATVDSMAAYVQDEVLLDLIDEQEITDLYGSIIANEINRHKKVLKAIIKSTKQTLADQGTLDDALPEDGEISITKKDSGALVLSTMHKNHLVSRTYMGYTKKEAKRIFKEEVLSEMK